MQQVIEFLREQLHEAFKFGCQLTAKDEPFVEPTVSEPIPEPSLEDQRKAVIDGLLEGQDLLSNWDGTPNSQKRKTLEILLNNFLNDQENSANPSFTKTIKRIILPITRRVFSNLLANEIVGVQAMTGPVDQIHVLQVIEENKSENDLKEALKILKFDNLSDETIKTLLDEINNLNQSQGIISENRLLIQIMKEVVEAKTRKFDARWTFECAQDMMVGSKLRSEDIEAEIMAALSQETTVELDQMLLSHLDDIVGDEIDTIFDPAKIDCSSDGSTPIFVGDVHAALAVLINRKANSIAGCIRRGAGNWCVVSPTALTILQSAATAAFARSTTGILNKSTSGSKYVGTLNNHMKVYLNQYAANNIPVLVGYKGNDVDAGAFYCPQHLILSSGPFIDPESFEPLIKFNTRYGFLPARNSKDYFGKIGINADTISFT